MPKKPAKSSFDLEERTLQFASDCKKYINKLPKSITNNEYAKQLVRSSGSTGANYIEANERLSKKDFLHRIKISRKEAKESRYWITLSEPKGEMVEVKQALIDESTELIKIFNAIVTKSQ